MKKRLEDFSDLIPLIPSNTEYNEHLDIKQTDGLPVK